MEINFFPLNPSHPPFQAQALLGDLGLQILQAIHQSLQEISPALDLGYREYPPGELGLAYHIEFIVIGSKPHLATIHNLFQTHLKELDFTFEQDAQGYFQIKLRDLNILISTG